MDENVFNKILKKIKIVNNNSSCKICGGLEWIYDKNKGYYRCLCFYKRLYKDREKILNIPKKYKNASFSFYKPKNLSQFAFFNILKEYALIYPFFPFSTNENISHEKYILYIYGETGVGKTYLSIAFLNYLLKHKGISGYFIPFRDLLNELRNRLGDKQSFKDYFLDIKSKEILILDDVGAERDTEFVRDILFDILDYRYNNRKLTLITSNLSPKRLILRLSSDNFEDTSLGERLYSRLCEVGEFIYVEGKDERKL